MRGSCATIAPAIVPLAPDNHVERSAHVGTSLQLGDLHSTASLLRAVQRPTSGLTSSRCQVDGRTSRSNRCNNFRLPRPRTRHPCSGRLPGALIGPMPEQSRFTCGRGILGRFERPSREGVCNKSLEILYLWPMAFSRSGSVSKRPSSGLGVGHFDGRGTDGPESQAIGA
jgi:hypothetical protein